MTSKRFERRTDHKGRFMPRDQQIVVSVHECRYLTSDHIQRLYFGSATRCRTRVRYLFDIGYLKKRESKFPNVPDVYYLGLRGRRYLAQTYKMDSEWLDRVSGNAGDGDSIPFLMMKHELTLANIYVDACLECRKHGWTMEWRNTRMLELLSLDIQPDAYIKVSKEGEEMEAFIEFTDALTDLPEIRKKIVRYEQLLKARPVVTLWFTASLSKAKTIRRLCNESEYKSWFLVGVIEDRADFLTRPVWMWSESEDRVYFIKLPEAILLRNGTAT